MFVMADEKEMAMAKIVYTQQIIVSSDRLDDCKDYLGDEFHAMIDHALSVGWSLDEVIVALKGLAAEEASVPGRAITIH